MTEKTAVKIYIFSPLFPVNSSCNKLLFTHNFPTCLSKILHSFYSSPIFWPYLLNNIPISVKMVSILRYLQLLYFSACCLFFFFSFSPLLYPSSSSVLPLLPPFLPSSLSRVCCFSRTDTCEGDLELSMVRHQPEGLDQLQAQTQFTRKELQSLYRGFKNVGKQLETLLSLLIIPSQV